MFTQNFAIKLMMDNWVRVLLEHAGRTDTTIHSLKGLATDIGKDPRKEVTL